MKGKPAIVLLSMLLFACAQPPAAAPPAAPPPPPAAASGPGDPSTDRFVAIRRATCGTFLGLAPEDQAAASMFYIGYEANRAGAGRINVGLIPSIKGMALDFCAAEPNLTVASAFAQAYAEAITWKP